MPFFLFLSSGLGSELGSGAIAIAPCKGQPVSPAQRAWAVPAGTMGEEGRWRHEASAGLEEHRVTARCTPTVDPGAGESGGLGSCSRRKGQGGPSGDGADSALSRLLASVDQWHS